MAVSQVCSRICNNSEPDTRRWKAHFSYDVFIFLSFFLLFICFEWINIFCQGEMLKCWYPLPNLMHNRALHLLYMVSEILFYFTVLNFVKLPGKWWCFLSFSTTHLPAAGDWSLRHYLNFLTLFFTLLASSVRSKSSEAMALQCTKSLNLAPQLPSATVPRQKSRKRDFCKICQVLEQEPSSWSVHPCLFSKIQSFRGKRRLCLYLQSFSC